MAEQPEHRIIDEYMVKSYTVMCVCGYRAIASSLKEAREQWHEHTQHHAWIEDGDRT